MFCRNCGKELSEDSELCMSCGVRPPKGNKFCPTCGSETAPEAEMCVKCGTRLTVARSAAARPAAVAETGPTSKPTWAGVLTLIAGGIGVIIAVLLGLVFEAAGWAAGIVGLGAAWAIPSLILSVVGIVGGVYALRRRIWGLALAGAICAFLCFWPFSMLFAIPAIILVAMSKGEFS
jgi:hypothetical protein